MQIPTSINDLLNNNSLFGNNFNNKDNLNDLLANNTLLGNNLYISPMNNQELYNPNQSKPPANVGKISSSFFPLIKIL